MRALIFGGRGMLGRDLQGALGARGHEAVALARPDGDVTCLETVQRAVRDVAPDVVINCAAYTQVDRAESEPGLAHAVNGVGARNVAVAAADAARHVIHLSTDYVFDGQKGSPYHEWDPLAPRSVYGCSKALGEFQVRSVNARHTVVRTQWLFGAGGPDFVQTMLRLGQERNAVQVVDDQIGSPTYTGDLAAALVTLAERKAYGTYHITNGGSCSWQAFAQAIFRLAGLPVSVVGISTATLGRPAGRPLYSVLANQMWQAEGFPLLRPYEEALADYLRAQTGGG